MNKILRKYKQPLIVVGGSLLMIAWAMSGSMNQMGGDPADRVMAVTNSGKITAANLHDADTDFKAVQDFMPFLVRNGAMTIENGTHFYLMTKEAEAAGFLGGEQDGQAWIDELKQIPQLQQEAAQDLFRQWQQKKEKGENPEMPTNDDVSKHTSELINALANRSMNTHRLVPEKFFAAVAKARAINRYVTSFQFAPRVSDRRLAHNVTAEGDIALVDALLIPAERVLDKVGTPTPEELQAQFEKFKATKPGEGDLGAGYYQPARFKLEWLKLDRDAVLAAIDLDPIEVNKTYKSNRITYAGEFATERVKVETDLRNEIAARLMIEADRVIRAELLKVTAKLPSEGQYKRVPAEWDTSRPTLEALAQAVVREVKMPGGVGTFPLPAVVSKGGAWLKPADVATLPGIGTTELRVGTKKAVFREALFLVRELGFPNELAIQKGVPYVDNALVDDSKSRYYFTILDVKKEGPAESLEDCRDDVVRDVRLAKGLELLKGELPRLRATAVEKGLDAVAAEFPAIGTLPALATQKRAPVSRTLSQNPALNTADIRDQVMALAGKIDPTKDASTIPADERTLAAPLTKTPAVLVALVTDHIPATVEVFRANDFQLVSQLVGQELNAETTRSTVFSYAAIRQRQGYVATAGTQDETSDSAPTTPAPAAPGQTPAPVAPAPAKS